MKPISFIIPSRNNLKYLKWCYNSIRKNLGYIHEICIADDASEDGTWEWLQDISKKDLGVKIHRNKGPERQGLVVLYDLNKFKNSEKITNGIFAPWAIYKEDFWAVGGHDILFSPTSREDSDIFNRFHLNGCKFIQTWDGMVYHLTSRGSRFNSFSGGKPGEVNSKEWQYTNHKNIRNFIRKWGTNVNHDELMLPMVLPKYDIGFVIEGCDEQLLELLEPWCSGIYVDTYVEDYIEKEQPNTLYNLEERVHDIGRVIHETGYKHDIELWFDGTKFNEQSFQYIQQLSEILANDEELEVGEFELDIFKVTITNIKTYEEELIKCER